MKKVSLIFRPLEYQKKIKFSKSNFVKILKIRSSINLTWGYARSHNEFGPDRFSRFDFIGYKQTNRHPDKQSIYIDRNKVISVWGFVCLLRVHNS